MWNEKFTLLYDTNLIINIQYSIFRNVIKKIVKFPLSILPYIVIIMKVYLTENFVFICFELYMRTWYTIQTHDGKHVAHLSRLYDPQSSSINNLQ